MSDVRSLWRYSQLAAGTRRQTPPAAPVSIALRPLGGKQVLVRPGTSDVIVVYETFHQGFHRPPEELVGQVNLILDLGSNIGLTVADCAQTYPAARIVGVELDKQNAELARANVARYGSRCEVLERAVWWTDDEVSYGGTHGREYALSIGGHDADRAVRGITMSQLFDFLAPDGTRIDYVKMDIEGAEQQVLCRTTEWAARVRSMKVEYHDPYTFDQCCADLQRLGFATRRDMHRDECVIALRV
jgi:FkbM family methyltransferase